MGPCSGVVNEAIPNGATQFSVQVPSGCAVGGELIICNQVVTVTGVTPAGAAIAAATGTTSTTTTDMSFGLPWWFWLLMYCLCCLCLAMCGVIPLPFMTGKKKPVAKPMATPSVVEEVVTVEDEEPLVPMATAMVPTTVMQPTMMSGAVP